MSRVSFQLNGDEVSVEQPDDMPLLWVLRDVLALRGTKYGCGKGLCGACTVHVDGEAARSCLVTLTEVADRAVTTIEGLAAGGEHALVRAFEAEQVPQCGFCQPGQIMQAAALLEKEHSPSPGQIDAAMASNLCRCGTYVRIRRAIERASRERR